MTTLTPRQDVPVLPLRDVVVYPHMVIPLFVGRDKSIRALEAAMNDDKQIFLVAQHSAAEDNPGEGDLYQIGTLANILQLLKLPDGTVKVLNTRMILAYCHHKFLFKQQFIVITMIRQRHGSKNHVHASASQIVLTVLFVQVFHIRFNRHQGRMLGFVFR